MANTSKRGFASMNIEKQRLIASKGGRAAHAKGTAHEWSPEEARAAGRKGGESRGNRGRGPNDFSNDGIGLNAVGTAGQTGIGESLIGGPTLLRSNDLTSNFLAEAGSSLRNLNSNVVQSAASNAQQTTQQSQQTANA